MGDGIRRKPVISGCARKTEIITFCVMMKCKTFGRWMGFARHALAADPADLDPNLRFCCHTFKYCLLTPRKSLFSLVFPPMLTIKLAQNAGRNFCPRWGLKLVELASPSLCAI